MKNHLEYFFNIKIDNFRKSKNTYYFNYLEEDYIFTPFLKSKQHLEQMIKIVNVLKNYNMLVHEMIYSNNKNLITIFDNKNYILFKKNIISNKKISIQDIIYISNIPYDFKHELNWSSLWATKIDYFEYQMSQMKNKYPLIYENFNYFIGLSEVAIAYLNNTINNLKPTVVDNMVISHYRVDCDTSLEEFYNPINLTLDHKSRDLAEYLKSNFRNNNNIKEILDSFFKKNIFSEYGVRLLFSRLIFPTHFFDVYENIIEDKADEKDILQVILYQDDYELFLNDFYDYITKYINIPKINWLRK